MKKIMKNRTFQQTVLFLSGILLGWLLFYHSGNSEPIKKGGANKNTIWTCSMHPQIRESKPGSCPICGMDLIPLAQGSVSIASDVIEFTTEAMQLANIQTSIVKRGKMEKEIRMYGRVEVDERLMKTIPAHVPGRIEQLLVNYTGEVVTKGQTIAIIYSPSLVQAQQELIEAKKLSKTIPGAMQAAKEKLRQWKLTESQIQEIETTEKIISNFEVKSTVSGVVTKRNVNQGDYVSQGGLLFEISDLSNVWIVFDAYESDLVWIRMGDKVQFTLQSIPGKIFTSNVTFISPVIDNGSKVLKIRTEYTNAGKMMKPGMFATGTVDARQEGSGDKILVPRSAVLWTGKRSLVYVKVSNGQTPAFEMREIGLGAELKDGFVVLDGLKEGEEIATNGVFSIDAAAQLAGKNSMMNRKKEINVKPK